jgi:Domain of unknown function (DUF3387)
VKDSTSFVEGVVALCDLSGRSARGGNLFRDRAAWRAPCQQNVVQARSFATIRPYQESVRAQLRVLVKRILREHGYPPDKQEKATQTVLEQAAVLSAEWAVA